MIRMNTVVTLAVCAGIVASPLDAHAGIKARAKRMSDKAAKLFAEHKYEAAAELFEQAYALDSAKSIRLRNAGRAYEEARRFGRALHCFRRYVERADKPELKEDAKTRIARMEAQLAAANNPAMTTESDASTQPGARGAKSAAVNAKPTSATTGAKVGPSKSLASQEAGASSTGTASTIGVATAPKRSLAVPLSIGAVSVAGILGGGALLWFANGAATDVDTAESRGDYGYPTGATKLKDDRAAISLNQGIGWGLVGVGLVGAGVSTWLAMQTGAMRTGAMRTGAKHTAALLPVGPSDGAGLTALVPF